MPLLAAIPHSNSGVQGWLLDLHGPVIYLIVGGLVAFELGTVIGFFIPGEIATVIGGVLAAHHEVDLWLMLIVAAGAAIGGNLIGFEIGRKIGPWLLDRRPLRGRPAVSRARDLLARRGAPAVIVGRWVAVVRALLPGMAGISGMSRNRFAISSVVGGLIWGPLWVLVGFVASDTYSQVVRLVGWVGAAVFAVLVVAVVVTVHRSSRARAAKRLGG